MDSFGEVPERRSQLFGEIDDPNTHMNLQKTSALVEGGLNSGWRPGVTGATAVPKIPSRFDTTSGPARWKDEANGRRLDGSGGDRWTEVGPGGSHLVQAFPTDLFSSGDRWAAPDPNAGRGRGRGMVGFQDPSIVGGAGVTWKPRAEGAPVGAPPGAAGGPEWRGAGSEVNPRNDWRNDRWNAAPGSRNSQDTWRGAGGPGGGPSAGRGVGVGGPVGFNSGAPGGLGGLGGGFSIGRGSGTFTRSDSINSANGAGRGSGASVGGASLAASGRSPSSSFFRSFGPGGGVGGSLAWGPSKAQRRYTTDQLAFVYRQLLNSSQLRLPRSVERDDPLLFIADGDFVDVVDQFSGVDPRISAEVYLEHQALMQRVHSRGFLPGGGALGDIGGVGSTAMSPPQGQLQGLPEEHQLHQQMHQQQMQQPHSAFIDPMPSQQQQQHQLLPQQQQQQQQMMGAADPGWVYRDPQGMVQGPFPKQDIVEWFQGGFFPLELQLRPATDPPNAPFYPLSDLLQIWRGPAAQMMGGPAGFAPQQQQQPQQQQHGFVGGMGMPQEMVPQQQQGNSVGFIGQQVPQQAQQQLHQQLGGGLPDELMLSGHLQHLSMGGLSAPQQQQQQQQQQQLSEDSFVPAPFDPIVDPALVKRSASKNMLVQQESLGGGLLGSQQQQQESRQPAWNAAPAAAPPAAQAAAAAQPGGGLSLAAIQEEEQRRMREQEEQRRQQQQQQQQQMAGAPPPPPPPPQGPPSGYEMEPPSPQRQRPETKVAPWVSSVPTPESAGKTLLEIQAEESERQAQLEAQQAAANRLAAGPPGGGWARVARGTTVSGPASGPSLLEIQQAEERAKAAAAAAAAGENDDDSLFWEYDNPASGGAPPPSHNAVMPPPPPAPKAKVGGWAAAASKAPIAVPISAKPNGAAAGARPATIAVVRPPPPPPPRSASSSGMPAFVPPSVSDEDMAAILAAAAGESAGDGSSSSALSGPFRSWCVEQMQELTGSTDVTLCEFLMTVESNSEVAEYVSTYLGATPTAAKFTAEFLKLKLAEQASTGKKSRKARAKANAAAAALTNGGASAGKSKGGASGAGGDDDTDTSWAQVSDAGAKKTKKKGQKAEGTMLFSSGTNYSLLDDA